MGKLIGVLFILASLAVGIFGLALVFGIILAFPTMWLWNFVIPHISNGAVPTIGFWHAFALNVLCGILFKSKGSTSTSSDD